MLPHCLQNILIWRKPLRNQLAEKSWAREKCRWVRHQISFCLSSPTATTLPLVTWNRQFAQAGGEFPIQETQKYTTFYHRRTNKTTDTICIPKQAWVSNVLVSAGTWKLLISHLSTWPINLLATLESWFLKSSQQVDWSTSLTTGLPLRNTPWIREWTKEIVSTAQWLRSAVLVLMLKSLLQHTITKKNLEQVQQERQKPFPPALLLLQWLCFSDWQLNHQIQVSAIN